MQFIKTHLSAHRNTKRAIVVLIKQIRHKDRSVTFRVKRDVKGRWK